jgi:hypothetical protein
MPLSKCLLSKRNKANDHTSATAGVEGSFALLGGDDGVNRETRGGGQDGPPEAVLQQSRRFLLRPGNYLISEPRGP